MTTGLVHCWQKKSSHGELKLNRIAA